MSNPNPNNPNPNPSPNPAPQEMNKLRSELYSDSGLGSIRSELDALRSGGLEQIQQQVEQIRTLTLGLGLGLTLAQQAEQVEAA